MPTIILETRINAAIEVCFDLSRSIDLHTISTAQSKEKAVAGTTSGLINLGESVTWEATHFGIKQQLTSIITAYNRPFHFRDEQIEGIFQAIVHDHLFEQQGPFVVMKDIFAFKSPGGVFGNIFNKLVLTNYLTRLLLHRNGVIKAYAESDRWSSILNKL